jgi:FkbM family methyltransferase
MERFPIRVLRRVLPRYHGTGFGRLLFKAADTVARFIENDNYSFEENGELRVVQCLAKSGFGSPIFDVGANIGEYAVLARHYFPDSAIYAFEPVKETYMRLCRETEGLNIHAFNFGLGDQDADVPFSVQPHNLTNSSAHGAIMRLLNPGAGFYQEACRIRHSGSVAEEQGLTQIGLLKVDTEGHDWFVLSGFEEWLRTGRIAVIQFEYGMACISTKKLLFDYYQLLSRYNYRIGKIFPTYVDFRSYHPTHENFIGPNFLAVHPSYDLSVFE